MNECGKNDFIKKLMNYHVVFIIDNDLSINYFKPENIENLGELGYAISRDFKTGIIFVKNKEVYVYDVLDGKTLEEIKKNYMHHSISSKPITFECWVGKE